VPCLMVAGRQGLRAPRAVRTAEEPAWPVLIWAVVVVGHVPGVRQRDAACAGALRCEVAATAPRRAGRMPPSTWRHDRGALLGRTPTPPDPPSGRPPGGPPVPPGRGCVLHPTQRAARAKEPAVTVVTSIREVVSGRLTPMYEFVKPAGQPSADAFCHAVVAIVVRDERALFVKRSEASRGAAGYWTPVSGGVEPGESEAEAVRREVREEVALEVEAEAKVATIESHDGRYLLHFWTCRLIAGEARVRSAEVADLRWLDQAELAELAPVFDEDVRIVRAALAANTSGWDPGL